MCLFPMRSYGVESWPPLHMFQARKPIKRTPTRQPITIPAIAPPPSPLLGTGVGAAGQVNRFVVGSFFGGRGRTLCS